jgi:hypothetical protein
MGDGTAQVPSAPYVQSQENEIKVNLSNRYISTL